MRNTIFLIVLATTIFSCDSNNEPDHLDPEPTYSVEGKWLWSPDPDDRSDANTMFEFVDGNVYTSYCITCPADDAYWNSLGESDRIPGVDTYSFDGNTLIWDEIPQAVSFECDGGILAFENGLTLWRLSSDCQ